MVLGWDGMGWYWYGILWLRLGRTGGVVGLADVFSNANEFRRTIWGPGVGFLQQKGRSQCHTRPEGEERFPREFLAPKIVNCVCVCGCLFTRFSSSKFHPPHKFTPPSFISIMSALYVLLLASNRRVVVVLYGFALSLRASTPPHDEPARGRGRTRPDPEVEVNLLGLGRRGRLRLSVCPAPPPALINNTVIN